MTGYIYSLAEKDDIFYVGCTVNPYGRLQAHNLRFGFHEYDGGFGFRKKHFKGLEMEIIEEIEFTNYRELFRIEKYWIRQFNAWGFELINIQN